MTYKDGNIGKSDCACSVKAIQTYPNLAEGCLHGLACWRFLEKQLQHWLSSCPPSPDLGFLSDTARQTEFWYSLSCCHAAKVLRRDFGAQILTNSTCFFWFVPFHNFQFFARWEGDMDFLTKIGHFIDRFASGSSHIKWKPRLALGLLLLRSFTFFIGHWAWKCGVLFMTIEESLAGSRYPFVVVWSYFAGALTAKT